VGSKKENGDRASREVMWEVRLAGEGFTGMGETILIPAALVDHKDSWTTLRDDEGRIVFGSPMVRYVRRAQSDSARQPDTWHLNLPGAMPMLGDAADPGPVEAGQP
jgi:hypothetical protein